MKRWLVAVATFGVMGALASPAVAAQAATMVLKSGERVSGELVDMGGSGFTVRVSGTTRQIPTAEVAVIDFAGDGTNFPQSELDQVTGSQHVAVLSNGQSVTGRLRDVSGSQPLKISLDTNSGARDFNSTEIRRIYLARPGTTGSTSTASTAPGANTVRVAANQLWTDSGIVVRRGDRVTFNASGQIQLSGDSNDTATPAGAASGRRPSSPMPQVLAGGLIGRIGDSQPFGIGNQTQALEMPADGRLYLGVNDDQIADNRGEFTVQVQRVAGPLRRR